MQGTEFAHGLLNGGTQLFVIRDVARYRYRTTAAPPVELGDRRVELVFATGENAHVCPAVNEHLRDRLTDALGSAGDESCLAGQVDRPICRVSCHFGSSSRSRGPQYPRRLWHSMNCFLVVPSTCQRFSR
jgi:hypothetical protein